MRPCSPLTSCCSFKEGTKLLLYKFHLQFLDVIYDFLCKHECIFILFFVHTNIQQSKNKEFSFFCSFIRCEERFFCLLLIYSGVTFGQILRDFLFVVSRHLVRTAITKYNCRWRKLIVWFLSLKSSFDSLYSKVPLDRNSPPLGIKTLNIIKREVTSSKFQFVEPLSLFCCPCTYHSYCNKHSLHNSFL